MAADAFKRDSPREQEESCIPFSFLAVDVTEHHFYDTLLGKIVTNAGPVSRGKDRGSSSW